VSFKPVIPADDIDVDTAIALQAEHEFDAAKADGHDHRLLVRVDTKDRADALGSIYAEHTNLRLRVIHSGHAYSRVRRAIADLVSGDLDGLIAVDMLGEGFDFPKLKIGAVHTPHKSLSATLQFIGRFARGNDPQTGDAVLVGAENDIKHQAKPLWVENAAWHLLIPELGDTAIYEDQASQEFFGSFDDIQLEATGGGVPALAIEGLRPSMHAKAYEQAPRRQSAMPMALPIIADTCLVGVRE